MKNGYLKINQISLEKASELYMPFDLSEKIYAIPAVQIVESIQLPFLTEMEKAPDYVIGMMNLRGKIISVIDLRKFLGLQQKNYSADQPAR